MLHLLPSKIQSVVMAGGIVAYPTEAVFGLGCDPKNEQAIRQLLELKKRPWEKGLILVASERGQLADYVDFERLSQSQLAMVEAKWPGPVTFIMPIKQGVTPLLSGSFQSIAVRVSAHSVVKEMCDAIGGALVSTSANLAGMEPALSIDEIENVFTNQIEAVVVGKLGEQLQPSTIIDALSGKVLRA